MRVTNQMLTDHSIKSMSDSLSNLYELQKKASANKQFLNASDDPAAAATVATLKSTLTTSEVYLSTASSTTEWLSANDIALGDAMDIAQKTINLITQGLSDTIGAEERKAIATEVNGLLNQVMDLGNAKHLNRYVFAGFSTDTAPFVPTMDVTDSTKIASVQYKPGLPAGFQAIQREIGPGETITANIDGSATFMNLINTLIAVRDDLDTNNMADLRIQRDNMDIALEDVTHSSTMNGARMRNVDDTTGRIEMNNIDLEALLAEKEQVNMPEVLSLIANQKSTYELVIQITAQTQSMMNLFSVL
ncbi:MAG: flagellar hook-associated protein FlgL [Anaerolineaceae bacterium]